MLFASYSRRSTFKFEKEKGKIHGKDTRPETRWPPSAIARRPSPSSNPRAASRKTSNSTGESRLPHPHPLPSSLWFTGFSTVLPGFSGVHNQIPLRLSFRFTGFCCVLRVLFWYTHQVYIEPRQFGRTRKDNRKRYSKERDGTAGYSITEFLFSTGGQDTSPFLTNFYRNLNRLQQYRYNQFITHFSCRIYLKCKYRVQVIKFNRSICHHRALDFLIA